ncbi:MAG: hypothetical protein BHW07_01420 [Clostridium sp. CAG_433_25_7]|nr:MAG: hypothetical protein BHW07_01420 [Clostridium sp. CAG_433_25_7]
MIITGFTFLLSTFIIIPFSYGIDVNSKSSFSTLMLASKTWLLLTLIFFKLFLFKVLVMLTNSFSKLYLRLDMFKFISFSSITLFSMRSLSPFFK